MGKGFLSNPIVVSVAEKLQKTPAQVALRWGLQMGHSVLPKSVNETRMKENLSVFGWSIPEDLMAKFSEIPQACLNLPSYIEKDIFSQKNNAVNILILVI
jgi:diketogulonate reductase-like aldo/keto reductase